MKKSTKVKLGILILSYVILSISVREEIARRVVESLAMELWILITAIVVITGVWQLFVWGNNLINKLDDEDNRWIDDDDDFI